MINKHIFERLKQIKYKQFDHSLQAAIRRSKKNSSKLVLLYFNIKNLSKIKDQLGFDRAELIIDKKINSISQDCYLSCIVSRVNEFEFIAYIPDLYKRDSIEHLVKNIDIKLNEPVKLDTYIMNVHVCFGVAIYPDSDTASSTLKTKAYSALQRVMDSGCSNYTIYETKQREVQHKQFIIEQCLNSAIEHDELSVVLQPRVSTLTGMITCVEALVRWNSKELGIISPSTLIPYAEKSGLIHSISEWIYRETFKQIVEIQSSGYNNITVTINVSPHQIYAQTITPCLSKLLEETGIDPNLVELEINEGILLNANSKTINTLTELRDLGVKLALDDFGTGYSSLSFLNSFTVDTLKINRKFIEQLPYSESYFNIIKAIIGLSKSLNLQCIAEGVDTFGQFQSLKGLGCILIQGNFFSGPVEKKKLLKLLEAQEITQQFIDTV